MRKLFAIGSILLLVGTTIISLYFPRMWWSLMFFVPLISLGIYDLVQKKHTILRNFPVLGHFRYLLESIGPEIRQYFVESDISGRPFTRLQRNFVYKRAKQQLNTHPFGTELNVYDEGYMWMAHSMYPKEEMEKPQRVMFGGKECTKPYSSSVFNISAMSYGSLGKNAVTALSTGAKLGGFFQNTGEGGLAPYHLDGGGDLVWQIGTGYFGCRTENGDFSDELFQEKSSHPNIKMIEIKLSQGAKPGLGGVLPAEKNTPEIAKIRHLIPHKIVHSPPAHKSFADAPGLLEFVRKLRNLSGGKPVGFKLCIGSRQEFINICEAIISTGIYPDFITVDGGEGGTGAAPIEFSDNVGMPLNDALVFVVDTLRGYNLKKDIRVIASCKVMTGFDIVKNLCIGADACNCARGMLFALGCIQALKCDTNQCPTGITTHRPELQAGLNIADKSVRVANFHKETVKSAMALLTAAGLESTEKLNRTYIYKRVDQYHSFPLEHIFPSVEEGEFLKKKDNVAAKGEQERYNLEGQPERRQPVDPQKNGDDYPKENRVN
ncbi:MAG: FMN-binding glutamate synthase family protein [Sphingobacteriales bacterium]|nr:MAG: FMN-binding glutamate synthase family protein [Sphingobacteriales bacterium]